ncbi:MAG: pentapeptide repeat-containing protein [Candidatus Nitrosopolaris sp.]
MANCSFTTKYWNYESQAEIDYSCKEDSQVDSDKCILHDEEYLRLGIGSFLEEKKNNVRTKVMDKVRKSIDDEESLFFIGCYLPDVTIGGNFTKPAYFSECRFQGRANFYSTEFSGEAIFLSLAGYNMVSILLKTSFFT